MEQGGDLSPQGNRGDTLQNGAAPADERRDDAENRLCDRLQQTKNFLQLAGCFLKNGEGGLPGAVAAAEDRIPGVLAAIIAQGGAVTVQHREVNEAVAARAFSHPQGKGAVLPGGVRGLAAFPGAAPDQTFAVVAEAADGIAFILLLQTQQSLKTAQGEKGPAEEFIGQIPAPEVQTAQGGQQCRELPHSPAHFGREFRRDGGIKGFVKGGIVKENAALPAIPPGAAHQRMGLQELQFILQIHGGDPQLHCQFPGAHGAVIGGQQQILHDEPV